MMATLFKFIFQILPGGSPCRRPKFSSRDGDTPSLPKQKPRRIEPAGLGNFQYDQRLLNWKRLRAPGWLYFLRSFMRESRVRKPSAFNAPRRDRKSTRL